jgi:hypothetical protein
LKSLAPAHFSDLSLFEPHILGDASSDALMGVKTKSGYIEGNEASGNAEVEATLSWARDQS